MSAFTGLKVLELGSQVAAGFCGKLLAGFGADVVRMPLGREEFSADERHWLHTAKRELAFNPDEIARLIASADIVLDGAGIDCLSKLGFDAARLRALNPQLILCQITPFGQTGPRRHWQASDITLYALSGLMQSTGDGARAPLNARPRVCELSAGMNAFIACGMALLRRERDGAGETIDLSIHESAMENYEVAIAEHLANGKIARRNNDTHAMTPWRTYPCRDGAAAIIGGPIRNWLKAAHLFEAPALLEQKFEEMGGRIQHRAEFEALLKPWLGKNTKDDLFHIGQKHGLAWSPLLSLPEALGDPQHAARGFFVPTPQGTRPGAPFRPSRCIWREEPSPSADWSTAPKQAALAEAPARAPLAGLRVLDFTHDWAGPHAARLLADFGAEVIKIEYPKRLDGMRGGYLDKLDAHPRFWQLHRGKKSVTLDLKQAAHREVLEQMARTADLVIENSRPGVMDRKGFGYERLRELNPRVILLSMSAFGATGPYAQYCGYGGTLEAISGLQSLTAYDARSPWYRIREMDVMNGMMGACAALTALWHRQQTGEGQWIDLSECETTAWFVGEHFIAAARDGQPAALGNRHPLYAPQGCYAAKGEDRWLVLTVRSDEEWRQLAPMIGVPAPRFATAALRRAAHDELDRAIADWARQRDAAAAAQELQDVGIAAGYVTNAADLAGDPHLAVRGWFQTVGADRFPGFPFRLARGGAQVRGRGPQLGVHNAEFFGTHELPDLAPENFGTAFAIR